ncbi:hypothetical protein [Paraburkholderia kururiensis]|uniref:hypothetical protein n=1 Tax=Paraburkholderia kururiensis TaxID=984307 RepID=UPI000F87E76E|nr:hypothetical protein [Paraburkholderia kururiensis]
MTFLIDQEAQTRIAKLIDSAVERVLGEVASHGNEEGMTTALGHSLMKHQIRESDLRVDFKYRQHNKYTEERYSGADGGFLVRVVTPNGTVEKAALFQAKLIGGLGDVRTLTMPRAEAKRLQGQSKDMLRHTDDAVAIFYTHKNIYVVDAKDYSGNATSKAPLSQEHRLITLGTYLGKWMPRCSKGDTDPDFVTRARHVDGFKHGLSLNVVSQRPSVPWEQDRAEKAWRHKG